MMKYDFDRIIDRRNTDCLKCDFAAEFGRPASAIPMWIADMDFPAPPAVGRALADRALNGVLGYTHPQKSYFETVCGWFSSRYEADFAPEQIALAPTVVFAICALIRMYTRPGDAVIVCTPVYTPFITSIESNGRRVITCDLTEGADGSYSLDIGKFERLIADNRVKLYIACSPHNPVGKVWTERELAVQAEVCGRHGVTVVSDEIHCDFTFGGRRHVSYAAVGQGEFAVCTSPSKTFNIAGLQTANIYLSTPGMKKEFLLESERCGYDKYNVMGVTACEAAYRSGGEWLDELKVYIEANLDFAVDYVRRNIPKVKLRKPEGTYLLWLDCRGLGLSDEALTRFMSERAGLWLDEGTMFGSAGSGFQRMNAACPRSVLEKALESLSRAVSEL